MRPADFPTRLWRRRDMIKLLGASAFAGPAILRGTTAQAANTKVIKIGQVSPQTGPLAPFAEADPFILDQIRTALAKDRTFSAVQRRLRIPNLGLQDRGG
jgi:hypothetical protein